MTGRALISHKLEKLLINNQKLGIPALEDQGWLTNVSIYILSKVKLKRLAIVSSFDTMQQMTNEAIGCKIKDASHHYCSGYFFTEDEALEWLQENKVERQALV